MLKSLHLNHKNFWKRDNVISLLLGLILLIISLIFQKIANDYVMKTPWTYVWDILLNNVPTFNVDSFIILSTLLFTLVIIGLLLYKPKYILFTIKSLALFIIFRSFFISLTHLGIHPHQITFSPNSIWFWLYDILYNTKNDFFFSWHTGLPFLMWLIFYKKKIWRYMFFATSLIFAMTVIAWHIHYSIDVFAAPLITYSIYSISQRVFKKDYELIK